MRKEEYTHQNAYAAKMRSTGHVRVHFYLPQNVNDFLVEVATRSGASRAKVATAMIESIKAGNPCFSLNDQQTSASHSEGSTVCHRDVTKEHEN